MEDDLEELAEVGRNVSAEGLQMEARFVTVALLASAMTESLAHAIIAMAANESLRKPRRRPTLFELWSERIPAVIGCKPFLPPELVTELTQLSAIRNSITHANPRLLAGDEVISDGNTKHWDQLDAKVARTFVSLPLRLLEKVPQTRRYSFPLASFAADYWLLQAIARGKRQRGRSYNMWRPKDRESRLHRIKSENLS